MELVFGGRSGRFVMSNCQARIPADSSNPAVVCRKAKMNKDSNESLASTVRCSAIPPKCERLSFDMDTSSSVTRHGVIHVGFLSGSTRHSFRCPESRWFVGQMAKSKSCGARTIPTPSERGLAIWRGVVAVRVFRPFQTQRMFWASIGSRS